MKTNSTPSDKKTLQNAMDIISKLTNTTGFPQETGGTPIFNEPWQASIFGIVVALNEREFFQWDHFQSELIKQISQINPQDLQDQTEEVYYRVWVTIAEQILYGINSISQYELDGRELEFADGIRDASEFIIGGHSHPHGNHSHHH
jgi:nitrile hydratase accessory protein